MLEICPIHFVAYPFLERLALALIQRKQEDLHAIFCKVANCGAGVNSFDPSSSQFAARPPSITAVSDDGPVHRLPASPSMSTTRPRAQAQAQPVAQLPLGLQPFHVLYVSLVVAIVFGGTLYSLWSGSHVYNSLDGFDRLDVLSEASSSSPTAHSSFLPPTSYLADKRNVFNQIFVKRAWAWNTLAFIVQALILKSSSGGGMAAALKKKDDDAAGSAQANAAARTANASKATATKQSTISSPLSISFLRFGVATACWGECPLVSRLNALVDFLSYDLQSFSRAGSLDHP